MTGVVKKSFLSTRPWTKTEPFQSGYSKEFRNTLYRCGWRE